MKGRSLATQLWRAHLNSSTRRLSKKMERRMCAKMEQSEKLVLANLEKQGEEILSQTKKNFRDLADQHSRTRLLLVDQLSMRAKQIKESVQLQPARIGLNLAFLGIGILLGVVGCWDEKVRAQDKMMNEMLQRYREMDEIDEEREKEAAKKKKIEEQGKEK